MRPAADPLLQLAQREAAVDLRVAAVEDVEVDAVQDGDAVAGGGHPSSSSTAAADPSGVDQLPDPGLARLGEEDEADAGGGALLVALEGVEDGVDVDGGSRRTGRSWRRRIASTSLAQRRRVGEAQRRQQAEADRLAVAVALVAARRLDRVADRVAEVEHGAQAVVALVGGDDLALVAGAGEDDVVELGGVERRRSPAPAPRARRRPAGRSSAPRRSRRPAPPAAASPSVAVSAITAAGSW